MCFQTTISPGAITALIAAGGVVVGAVVTALAAAFSARQKIREVELVYEQKLRDNYLTNARQYIYSVYVPIGIALGSLGDAYLAVRQHIDFKAKHVDPAAQKQFEDACDSYLQIIDDLFSRGADAFLTSATELRLRSFSSFLRSSRNAKEPSVQMVFQAASSFIPAPADSVYTTHAGGKLAAKLYGSGVSVNIAGIGFSYSAKELIAAPLTSREFEKRLVEDIAKIKYLIKEVTLGTHSQP